MRITTGAVLLALMLSAVLVLCLPACKVEKKKPQKKRDRTQLVYEGANRPGEKKEEPEKVASYDKPQSSDPNWSLLSVDYQDKAPLYTAAIVAEEAAVHPEPAVMQNPVLSLPTGHLVEVLDTSGPRLTFDGENQTALPVRVLGRVGWVFEVQMRRIEPLRVSIDELWEQLWREGRPAAVKPADCQVRGLLAQMAEIPDEEVVVFASGTTECGRGVGIFSLVDRTSTLLAARFDLETTALRVRPHSRGNAFLDVTAYWMGGPALMGDRQYLLGLVGDRGPLEVFFETDKAVVDSSSQPARYLLSTLAYPQPDHDNNWFIQQRRTVRVMTSATGEDSSEETFYRWDGRRFSEVPPPPGIPSLPQHGTGLSGPEAQPAM